MSSPQKVGVKDRATFENFNFPGSPTENPLQAPQVNKRASKSFEPQGLDTQLALQLFEFGSKVGEVVGSMKSQREVLIAGNKILKKDIVQIERAHRKELNAAVDVWEAKTKTTVQKLRLIVDKIISYSTLPKYCGAFPIDISSLQTLINSIPTLNYRALKIYPDRPDSQTSITISKEDLAIPLLEELISVKTLLFQNLIESRRKEFEILTEDIKTSKMTHFTLTNIKKADIEFHEAMMKDFDVQMEKKLGLSKVIDKAYSILRNITWEIPKTSHGECKNCFVATQCPRAMHPQYREPVHSKKQDEKNEELQKLYEWVSIYWSSISSKKIQ